MKNRASVKFNFDKWRFFVQVWFSNLILALCICKLLAPSESINIAIYWSGITGILGYWLPAPGQNKDEKEAPNITQRTFSTTNDPDGSQNLAQVSETTVTQKPS